MIGFLSTLAGLDWLAVAGWGGAGLLAAAAVWAFVALPTARWAWKALGLGAAVLVTLLLFRGALQKAEARGYNRAAVEFEAAAQAQAEAWKAQVDAAARDLADARVARRKAVQSAKAETHAYYKANPGAAGVVCLPDERVQVLNNAAAKIHSQSASGGRKGM